MGAAGHAPYFATLKACLVSPKAIAAAGLSARYLLDALGYLDGTPTSPTVHPTMLTWISDAEHACQPSVGLGEDVRIRSEAVIGSALVLDGELVQLSAFTSADGGQRAFGRIARPSVRR